MIHVSIARKHGESQTSLWHPAQSALWRAKPMPTSREAAASGLGVWRGLVIGLPLSLGLWVGLYQAVVRLL